MKKVLIMLFAMVLLLAGCSTNHTEKSSHQDQGGTTPQQHSGPTKHPSKIVGKTQLFLHVTKKYEPKDFPKTSMNGEPSDIHFFKPEKDEGIRNRDYPNYDNKTFKFLSLPGSVIPPQDYYMFQKGLLAKALAGTGYKATEIMDSGHIKILPNLYVGYYDFAWVPLNVLTEYWSGYESMNQELWRDGNDYVVIANSYNGGISMIASPNITDIRQLAGQKVGIMNPSFNIEALFNKKLNSVGLATESAGGSVKIEMGMPGLVMNDLEDGKAKAVFAWGMYEGELRKRLHYKELLKWQDMGYGTKAPYVVLVVRRDILEKHPDIVQKVVQANYDASQMAIKDGEYEKPEAQRFNHYWSYYMGRKDLKAQDLRQGDLVSIDPEINEQYLKDIWDYMTKCGYLKVPYKFGELVNLSFQNKIVK